MERIARQARSEKRKNLFQIFSRQGANEILVTSMARWEEHVRVLIVVERECLELSEEIEHLSEKQEVLATLMEFKMSMQKVAPEDFQGLIFQELKAVRGSGSFFGALENSSFGSCSSSLAHHTDEAMSASSWVAQDADDAMSESSWTARAKEKERDWWSVDLEGEMEKLEVVSLLSRTDGGSVDPEGEMGHWSARTRITKEEK